VKLFSRLTLECKKWGLSSFFFHVQVWGDVGNKEVFSMHMHPQHNNQRDAAWQMINHAPTAVSAYWAALLLPAPLISARNANANAISTQYVEPKLLSHLGGVRLTPGATATPTPAQATTRTAARTVIMTAEQT
jgi:hypothetical protein